MKRLSILLPFVVFFFIGCPATWENACKIYLQRGEYAQAKEQALVGIQTTPDNYVAYCLLGKAETGLGNYDEASKAFQNAYKKDSVATIKWLMADEGGKNKSVFWQAFYSSALKNYLDKNYQDALTNLRFAQKLDPTNASQFILEGNIYADMGNREMAYKAYQKVLEFDRENAEATYFIGKMFFDKQVYDSCLFYTNSSIKTFEKEYGKLKNLLFKNVEFNQNLAVELITLWKEKKRDALDQFLKVKLGFDEGLNTQERNVEKFVKENEGYGRSHYLAGIVYLNLRNDTLALRHLTKSAELLFTDPDALYFTGELLVKMNKWVEARKYFDELVRIKPDDFAGWFYIGVCYAQEKNYKKAIEIYEEKALPLEPTNIDLLTNLAFAYREIGNTKKAMEYLQKADKILKEKK
ncbi:MAG: tetratricopeptide repeat protein [candidate division WOR-3 bacterium]